MGLCTHVGHRLYKYTLGSEQDTSSPTELSSLFEPPLSAALQQMVVLMHLLVCDRVVFSFWWYESSLVSIWHILWCTILPRCSFPATSSVGIIEQSYYLSLDVLWPVSHENVIWFCALALVLLALPVSIYVGILLVASLLPECCTIVPSLLVGSFELVWPFLWGS